MFKHLILVALVIPQLARSQDSISVRIINANKNIYMLDCVGGFGGGNVAASIGDDGILLVDDMYEAMSEKLKGALKTVSDKPIRFVLNSHFHGDHIQGNRKLSSTATIIGHANIYRRMLEAKDYKFYPFTSFSDRLDVRFNGENIRAVHLPNCHTDSDVLIYFENSRVLHLGDMFFIGMFPAVYTEGGGDLKNLIRTLEQVLKDYPADVKVIPGHGDLATMDDLRNYVTMLKETVAAAEEGISKNKTAAETESDPRIRKYAKLGEGGAQTTAQYTAMLFKLLKK